MLIWLGKGAEVSKLVNVGPWLPGIRRRARLLVLAQELEALERELRSSRVKKSVVRRVRELRGLIDGM